MRGLRGATVALFATAGIAGLAALAAVGCGDDTSASNPDSGSDVTTDTNEDVVQETGPEASHDGPSTQDVAETGTTDSSDGGSTTDADAADAPPPALVYAQQHVAAFCQKLLGCCPGGVAGHDLANCEAHFSGVGWEGTLPDTYSIFYRNNYTFDANKAAGCITAINGMPCGMQTAAQWAAITSACELVIQGTLPSNTNGCLSSFECASGNYCDPTVDGGLCTPLAAQGQPCNTKIASPVNPIADQMCSYLGSGQPALFCDLVNNGPDAAACRPLVDAGGNCVNSVVTSGPYLGYYDDQACAVGSNLCGDNSQCGGSASYPYTAFCNYYIADAGGGG